MSDDPILRVLTVLRSIIKNLEQATEIGDPHLRALMVLRSIISILEILEQATDDLKRFENDHDVIGDILAGGYLELADAAYAWNYSKETVRQECAKAAATKQWIGVKIGGRYILGEKRFFNYIQRTKGKHARLEAEDRLKQRRARGNK